jgi:hypothetical protein
MDQNAVFCNHHTHQLQNVSGATFSDLPVSRPAVIAVASSSSLQLATMSGYIVGITRSRIGDKYQTKMDSFAPETDH